GDGDLVAARARGEDQPAGRIKRRVSGEDEQAHGRGPAGYAAPPRMQAGRATLLPLGVSAVSSPQACRLARPQSLALQRTASRATFAFSCDDDASRETKRGKNWATRISVMPPNRSQKCARELMMPLDQQTKHRLCRAEDRAFLAGFRRSIHDFGVAQAT